MTKEEALRKFPDQIGYALENYTAHGLNLENYSNCIIGGLGGSGIGGRLIKAWFADRFPIPVEVVSDYKLPAYANSKTLIILSSYSGNTEETLQLFDEAIARGNKPIVLTTGGRLLEKASENNCHTLLAEKGYQPRFALGYSFSYLLQVFGELLGELENMKTELRQVANHMRGEIPRYEQEMADMLQHLGKQAEYKIVVVCDARMEGVAIRFCQQVQENAKHEAFWHLLPEANHNVIESYYGNIPSVFIFLRSNQHERVEARFDFVTSLLEVEYHRVINLTLEEYELGGIFALIYRLDAFSLLLADLRKVDALEIANINSLKDFLEGME